MKQTSTMIRAFFKIALPLFSIATYAQEKPNIILLLVDDMGWSDLGCYARDDFHETPNIDRMAGEGMRFTNGYAACSVSSPTRASIMTGQYPARLQLTDWIPGHGSGNAEVICPKIYYELPTDRTTIAQALRQKGYKTLHIGKWHLGEDEKYWPENYGFDVNIGGHSLGAPGSYYFPYAKLATNMDWTTLNLPEGLKDGEYLTDVITCQALNEIEKSAQKKQPFFLNMSYYQVHVPLEGKPENVEKYRNKWDNGKYSGTKNLDYAAMIQSLDESVGRILDKLQELGIEKETFILLTSDNGGLAGKGYNGNAPLRDGKGTYYEGGIREPFIIRYPGKVAGGAISDEIVVSTDIYSTILDVAGASALGNSVVDGISILPYATGKNKQLKRDAIYWHYPHFHVGPPASAVRQKDYKLIEFLVSGKVELYNLADDIGETKDLAASMPQKVKELQGLLHHWKKTVGAEDLIKRTPENEKFVRNGNERQGANNIKNPPVFELSENNQVKISTFNEGIIRYTLDGSEPTEFSAIYTQPLDRKEGGEVRAKSWSVYKGQNVESDTYICRVPVQCVKLVSVSSENKSYPSTHILDTLNNTYWESNSESLPESAVFDLGEKKTLRCFSYQPARRERIGIINYRTMPDNRQGAITDYQIEVGDDLQNMKIVKTGCFSYRKYAFLEEQTEYFDTPVSGQYIRFTALSSIDKKTVVNIQSIKFITQ